MKPLRVQGPALPKTCNTPTHNTPTAAVWRDPALLNKLVADHETYERYTRDVPPNNESTSSPSTCRLGESAANHEIFERYYDTIKTCFYEDEEREREKEEKARKQFLCSNKKDTAEVHPIKALDEFIEREKREIAFHSCYTSVKKDGVKDVSLERNVKPSDTPEGHLKLRTQWLFDMSAIINSGDKDMVEKRLLGYVVAQKTERLRERAAQFALEWYMHHNHPRGFMSFMHMLDVLLTEWRESGVRHSMWLFAQRAFRNRWGGRTGLPSDICTGVVSQVYEE